MTRHTRTTLRIGTISSGTLRMEDLIPALASELADLRLTRIERATVREALSFAFDREDSDGYQSQLYDDLCQIADNHCPDYAYFGSTEGDGAEIGVWPMIETLEEDARQRGGNAPVYKVNAGEPFNPLPAHYSHVMEVTDHGNVTLYRRSGHTWREVWSVV